MRVEYWGVFFSALLAASAPSAARAFCHTSVCPATGAQSRVCTPALPSDCGIPLRWESGCAGYSLQTEGSAMVPFETARAAFAQAFAAWTGAVCPSGGAPRLSVRELAPVACDAVEYNPSAANANVILFRDARWPHAGSQNSLAVTTLTFDVRTGAILDADMEINGAAMRLTTSEVDVENDLQSIVTHEAGHFLGIAHSTQRGATMEAGYTPRTTRWRVLAADDTAAVCAAYPPGEPLAPACDATPRRGLRATCAREGGCSVPGPSPTRERAGAPAALAAAMACATLARRMLSKRPA